MKYRFEITKVVFLLFLSFWVNIVYSNITPSYKYRLAFQKSLQTYNFPELDTAMFRKIITPSAKLMISEDLKTSFMFNAHFTCLYLRMSLVTEVASNVSLSIVDNQDLYKRNKKNILDNQLYINLAYAF
jgi:hypothetical protein